MLRTSDMRMSGHHSTTMCAVMGSATYRHEEQGTRCLALCRARGPRHGQLQGRAAPRLGHRPTARAHVPRVSHVLTSPCEFTCCARNCTRKYPMFVSSCVSCLFFEVTFSACMRMGLTEMKQTAGMKAMLTISPSVLRPSRSSSPLCCGSEHRAKSTSLAIALGECTLKLRAREAKLHGCFNKAGPGERSR